jgi:hypothetical protein
MQADGRRHAGDQERDDPAPHQEGDAGRETHAEEVAGERGDRVHHGGQAAGGDDDEAQVGNAKQKQRQAPARERPPDPRVRGTQDFSPIWKRSQNAIYRALTMSHKHELCRGLPEPGPSRLDRHWGREKPSYSLPNCEIV